MLISPLIGNISPSDLPHAVVVLAHSTTAKFPGSHFSQM
jgi:hypothetical protein